MTADTNHTYDTVIRDVGDNGEFLSWATVDYLVDGQVTESETFVGTSEEPPGYTGLMLAESSAAAWLDAMTYTLEERLSVEFVPTGSTFDYDDVPF